MSSSYSSIAILEYRDALSIPIALPGEAMESESNIQPPLAISGISEDEVERRVRSACETAAAEAEERFQKELDGRRQDSIDRVANILHAFEHERRAYFNRVEREVVQLALAIARKIVNRESTMDPALLSALVRIAIDRMQCESQVRVRIRPEEIEHWEVYASTVNGEARWQLIGDGELRPGDCIVETEMGSANFAFEAQLKEVEESFLQLLAHRPVA